MKIDADLSMITIAERNFPACAIICPAVGGDPDASDLAQFMLGVPSPHYSECFIPMESGLLVHIERYLGEGRFHGRITCRVRSRVCYLESAPNDEDYPLYLPTDMALAGGRLVPTNPIPGYLRKGDVDHWDDCEEEWLVEHIVRLTTLTALEDLDWIARPDDHPIATLLPLRQAVEMLSDLNARRDASRRTRGRSSGS